MRAKQSSPPPPSVTYTHHIHDLRLGEFDLGGVLYHARYYHLYEEGREALLRDNGVPYSSLVERSQHLAIVEAHQIFHAPIFYGDRLTLTLWTSAVARSSVTFHYTIASPRHERLHEGWTRSVFVDLSSGKLAPARFPEELRNVLTRYSAEG